MRLMNILYTNPNTKLNIKVKIKCLLGNKILKYQIEKNKYQFKYWNQIQIPNMDESKREDIDLDP